MKRNPRQGDAKTAGKIGYRSLSGPEQFEARLLMDGAAPQLVADTFAVHTNDDPQPFDVLANDLFGDDSSGARITAISFPTSGGTAQIAADGKSVLFRPSPDFVGNDSFQYVVDGQFTAEVSVRVISPLVDDVVTAFPDGQALAMDLLANDPFWTDYGGPRQITTLSATQLGGTLAIGADGRTVTYLAPDDPDTLGRRDYFTYVVDGKYAANVSVFLFDPLNRSYRHVPQNADSIEIAPLDNAHFSEWTDYQGDVLVTTIIEPTSGSSVSIKADGKTLSYRPADGFVGIDTIAYVVDGRFSSTIRVQVGAVVRHDSYQLDQNGSGTVLRVLANDVYRDALGDPHRIATRVTAVSTPDRGGRVEMLADGLGVRYTPAAGFVGRESFTYRANDRYTAHVTVNVSRPVRDDYLPKSGLPIVADSRDNFLAVLANDFHQPGDHTITTVGTPDGGGSVRIEPAGRGLLYTPEPGFVGPEAFSYTVNGQYEATVHVDVTSPAASIRTQLDPAVGKTYSIVISGHLPGLARYTGPALITEVSVVSGGAAAAVSADGRAVLLTSDDFSTVRISYTLDGKYSGTIRAAFRQSRFLGQSNTLVEQNQSSELDVLASAPWQYRRYASGVVVYQGARLITDAFGAQHGSLSVAADGKSVIYRPHDDFVGQDMFRYLVDGQEMGTATVRVIRRVRDDQYRVDPSSQDNPLRVTLNDQLGAGYTGIGRITAVEAPAHGSVRIAEDGRHLVYTPAAGFVGVDTVQYTVDGHLRATVKIAVESTTQSQFPRFEDLASLEEWLVQNALEQYRLLFGAPASSTYQYGTGIDGGLVLASGLGSSRHSETNVQVAGVDEADLTENDGNYLYVLSGGQLVISQARPGELLSVVSETPISGRLIGMYLSGDRLTVISQPQFSGVHPWLPPGWQPSAWAKGLTTVTVFDVADRTHPAVVQKTELDGMHVESRRVGDFVYMALDGASLSLPRPDFVDESPTAQADDAANRRYETEAEYVRRIHDRFGELLDSILPHFRSYGPHGELVRSGLLLAPEEIGRPLDPADAALLSVVTIDAAAQEPGVVASRGVVTVRGGRVYMNRDSLYILRPGANGEGLTTDVLKFAFDAANGRVEPVAHGQVPGHILDQFSVDEYNGDLRLATTVLNVGADNWSGTAENDVWVLRQDGRWLELIGGLQNLAHGESIRSVRYLGDRAVITTFPTAQVGVDPVYAIDLSDPTEPLFVGALTLPGFNQYMQFIDHTHVLTVGINAPAAAGQGAAGVPTQVSLFDVSDFAHPRLVDQFTLARFSSSLAQQDHHAFGWFSHLGLLALPITRSYTKREDLNGDGYYESTTLVHTDEVHYFRIHTDRTDGGVEAAGSVALGVPALRSAFIGETLYSIGDGQIVASTMEDPGTPVASVTWDVPRPIHHWPWRRLPQPWQILPQPWPIDIQPIQPIEMVSKQIALVDLTLDDLLRPAGQQNRLEKWIESARADLAARLNVTPESALLVLVEPPAGIPEESPTGEGDASGLKFVFRSGQRHLLYQVASGDRVELIDPDFQFQADAGVAGAEEPDADANRDGRISLRDVLHVINHLLAHGSGPVGPGVLRQLAATAPTSAADVNQDGFVSPHDVHFVVLTLLERKDTPAAGISASGDSAQASAAAAPPIASALVFSQHAPGRQSPHQSQTGLPRADSAATSKPPADSAHEVPYAGTAHVALPNPPRHDLALALTENWSPLEDEALLLTTNLLPALGPHEAGLP